MGVFSFSFYCVLSFQIIDFIAFNFTETFQLVKLNLLLFCDCFVSLEAVFFSKQLDFLNRLIPSLRRIEFNVYFIQILFDTFRGMSYQPKYPGFDSRL